MPISLIGISIVISIKRKEIENDTLGMIGSSGSIGKRWGDIGGREALKGPTKRAYVRWPSKECGVLARG